MAAAIPAIPLPAPLADVSTREIKAKMKYFFWFLIFLPIFVLSFV